MVDRDLGVLRMLSVMLKQDTNASGGITLVSLHGTRTRYLSVDSE
ncbi:hypothetical protein PF003_g40456 [Phytophthora fragariae]|nr:hypothetical protein PF003_g40456 [Phytophthora fragariae]